MTADPSKAVLVVGEKPPECLPGQHRNTSVPLILGNCRDALTITLCTGGVKTLETPTGKYDIFHFPAAIEASSEPPAPWPPQKPAREMAYLQLRNKRGKRY